MSFLAEFILILPILSLYLVNILNILAFLVISEFLQLVNQLYFTSAVSSTFMADVLFRCCSHFCV